MVSQPKKSAASPPFANSYLLLAIKILFIIIIILLLPKLVTGASDSNNRAGGRKNKRVLQKLQEVTWHCSLATNCSELVPEEAIMCVSRCISPECYQRIYAPNPLEDGEMDVSRAKEFEMCFKEQVRLKRRQDRSQRTN